MSKQDYLYEDPVIPSQQFFCVSFFNKFNVKQSIDNNNDYKKEILKDDVDESYSVDNNILGLKIRGGFSNLNDAKAQAKRLNELDPYHHVYVVDGGKWCAFIMKESDNNNFVEQTEYANDQLNDMMKKYIVYYKECYNKEKNLYREFFKIEKHPKLEKPWIGSKSNKISIMDKLTEANNQIDLLS